MGLPLFQSDSATPPVTHHTYADYLGWTGEARYQLIEGEAVLMAPVPDVRHQSVVMEVASQAHVALKGSLCQVFTAPLDVRLPKADEADDQVDTVVQPDILVVCDARKVDARGIRGAPDWIVEVLSPATAGIDHVKKRRIYERAGVREYWLIQPYDRILTVYTLENGQYGRPHTQELEGETPVRSLQGVSIQWDELATRLPPLDY